MENVELFK